MRFEASPAEVHRLGQALGLPLQEIREPLEPWQDGVCAARATDLSLLPRTHLSVA